MMGVIKTRRRVFMSTVSGSYREERVTTETFDSVRDDAIEKVCQSTNGVKMQLLANFTLYLNDQLKKYRSANHCGGSISLDDFKNIVNGWIILNTGRV